MASPNYPGVYVEEVSSGVHPIQAAGTSTAAFIGLAEKGDINKAVKVYNFTEYQKLYGGFLNGKSYLSHAVFQFFNNGGAQCYIIRVGMNNIAASITLNDRGTTAQESLTVSAFTPGAWGNTLALLVTDGSSDPDNEFNLSVFKEGSTSAPEVFNNLSMNADSPNFVETAVSSSKQISIKVNQSNSNYQKGSSCGAAAPLSLEGTGRTLLKININGDGSQEVDLADAVGGGAGQVSDLVTDEKIAAAIAYVVKKLTKLRQSTDQAAFGSFTCAVKSDGKLLLTSGKEGAASAVVVAAASTASQDATGLLKLGKLNGGQELMGTAMMRPCKNPSGTPPDNYFLVGDNNAPTTEVKSVTSGSGADSILTHTQYTQAFVLLDNIDDVSLIAVPGIGASDVVGEGMNYCANRSLSDCFFIGDMDQSDDTVDEAKTFMAAITPKNSYGAVYLPWLKMNDPTGKSAEPIIVPPSGYVAGLFSKTDSQRGVWKAPAGTAVALGGALGLVANFTDVQQGNLNPLNINVIRQFAGSGIVLWGARTVSSDAEWNYVPVRRMGIFLRVSIYRGIQWAVFEPNDEELWSQLRLNIGSFMMTLYRQGAFQGSMPSQAIFVKCDKETTTQDDINLGIVNVLVGFAPLKPAEFVIVKISQKAGQSS